ncbi:MAG: HupE/UreJ family protein, partial [Cyanobacteria bacterium P01_H01_bin.153]
NLRVLTLGNLKGNSSLSQALTVAGGAIAFLLFVSMPVLAHHPSGGKTPSTALEAFLSGMGHPVIGIDHLAFVIASGLLAAALGRGLLVPIAFVVASMVGTGIHLMSIDLPMLELVISASVLIFGILLALKTPPKNGIVVGLAAIAGIFHGFAYGEAIFGAEMGPLVAYLVGFAAIQFAIAAAAWWVGKTVLPKLIEPSGLALRFAGFVICGVGATFLLTLVVDSIFPA